MEPRFLTLAGLVAGFGVGSLSTVLPQLLSVDVAALLIAWLGGGFLLAVLSSRAASVIAFYLGVVSVAVTLPHIPGFPQVRDTSWIDGDLVELAVGGSLMPLAGLAAGLFARLFVRPDGHPRARSISSVALGLLGVAAIAGVAGPPMWYPVSSSFEIDVPQGWTTLRTVPAAPTTYLRAESPKAPRPYFDVVVATQPAYDRSSGGCLLEATHGMNRESWTAPSTLAVDGAALMSGSRGGSRLYVLAVARTRLVGLYAERLCYVVAVVVPPESGMADAQINAIISSFRFR